MEPNLDKTSLFQSQDWDETKSQNLKSEVESFGRQIYLFGDLLQLPWTQEAINTAQLNFILKMDVQPTK